MDVLRFTTAGSVDDGKSTLIGRLLYDAHGISDEDRAEIHRHASHNGTDLNLALLTDGLRAEREQGITIDVAYRYFATPKRKFIIADTPGHEQYTRNMVTGASTADLAVEVVDARRGVAPQTRRHAFVASLLRIPYMIVAVNKMDLVGYRESRFREVVSAFEEFAEGLDIPDITYIPISALKGDNVATASPNMPWYHGASLLHRLETANPRADRNQIDFRLPVQTVVRPHQDFRGFAGEVASGKIRPGEEVVVLPAGHTARVASIVTLDGEQDEAGPGTSVVLTLDRELDVGRGCMIARTRNQPETTRHIDADLCWMDETALQRDRSYLLQHTTHRTKANVSTVIYRINVDTMHREEADTFALNEIGRVELETAAPLSIDPYKTNRVTGSFVLVDPTSNQTVAAGMIRGTADHVSPYGQEIASDAQSERVSPNVVWEGLNISREVREARSGHQAAVIWLTGLSGSGKSTIARACEERLFARGCHTVLLDGDNLCHGLNGDLGFTSQDRTENVRRVGEVARLFFEQGTLTLCTFVSPTQKDRDRVRALLPEGRFLEIHVNCPLEVCRERDPKGLYKRAENGTLPHFSGLTASHEPPSTPELVLHSDVDSVQTCVDRIVQMLEAKGLLSAGR